MATGINAITTLLRAKSYLGLSTASTAEDTLLEGLIDIATTVIEGHLVNRPIINVATSSSTTLQSQTEYWDGECDRIFMKYFPISSITSIYDDPDRTYTDTDDTVASTSYVTYEESGEVRFDATRSPGHHSVRAIYTGGYTTATVPSDLEFVCWELVGLLYRQRDSLGISSKSFADGSASYYETRLSYMSKDIVAKYRNYNV